MKKALRQQGFATLAVALVLMFLVSLNVFMGASSSVIEQQTGMNSQVNEKSLNNAEAGVAAMLAQLNTGLANGITLSNAAITARQGNDLRYQSFYKGAYISSTGYGEATQGSLADTARRSIVQQVTPSVPGTLTRAPAGVNSLGSVNYGGNFKSSSVESGGVVSGNRGNAGTITENSSKFQVAITDSSGNALLDASGNPLSRLMTPDEQFAFFFGNKFCPDQMASKAPASDCVAFANDTYSAGVLTKSGSISSSLNPNKTPLGKTCSVACGAQFQADYAKGVRYFVVTNGLSINNGSGISVAAPLGSKADPVYIFVMDNSAISINGNAVIFGLIYVYTSASTYTCTCQASKTVTAITTGPTTTQQDDTTKPIYKLSSSSQSGAAKCSANSGCTDSAGFTVPKNSFYTTTYQQKTVSGIGTTSAEYGPTSYVLATVSPPNPSQCTTTPANQACEAATNKCDPAGFTSTTKLNSVSSCNYQTPAVSVFTSASGITANVVVTINNDSSFTGTGTSVLNGSFITSGNVASTNGSGFVDASGGNTTAMTPTPYKASTSGWTDGVR